MALSASKPSPAEIRSSVARSYLEHGIKPAEVAVMLQAKFHVVRSTAYKDIDKAREDMSLAFGDEMPLELGPDIESIQAQLAYKLTVAMVEGEAKDIAALVKALDTAKKWSGTLQTTANPYA